MNNRAKQSFFTGRNNKEVIGKFSKSIMSRVVMLGNPTDMDPGERVG